MMAFYRNIQDKAVRLWKKTDPFSLSASKQLQMAADLIPFGVWEYDLHSGYIKWNDPLYELLNISKDQFDHTLSCFKAMVHPDDRQGIEDIIQETIHTNAQRNKFLFRMHAADGTARFIQGNISLICNKDKEPVTLTGVCIDITNQKNTECQLKKERDRAELYLDAVEAMIIVLNKDAGIRLINQAGCKITGYSESEIINKDWYEIFAPEPFKEESKEAFLKIMHGEAIYLEYYERVIISKSGAHKCIAWRNTLLRDDANNITGVLATGTDITAKVEAEKESEAIKKMYKDIFENAVVPMLICDSFLRYKDANPAACKLLKYTREELLRMHVWQLTRPDKKQDAFPLWSDFIATKYQTGTIELYKKDETKIIVEYQATSEFIPGMHLLSLNDITQKKIAEQKLVEQNEKLRKIAWMQSHEVRKPLANIMGLLSLVDMKKIEKGHDHVFQFLKQSSDELDLIIRDIIEKSKAIDA